MIEYRTGTGDVGGEGDTLHGLVTPFMTWTTIGDVKRGGFKERIAPGTFKKTLQERDVVLIHNHNTAWPLASTFVPDGTGHLDLREDTSTGLRADAKPVQTSVGKDVLLLANAKVMRGMSFGFEVIKDSWTDDEGNPSDEMRGTQRTVQEVRLHEVTTTAFPAYLTSELSARGPGMGETAELLERRSAFRKSETPEGRAAAASYSDTHTCGECGSESQYGAYCTGCGEPMTEPSDSGSYCASCGSERSTGLSGEKRSNDETDSAESEGTEPAKTTPEDEAEISIDDSRIRNAVMRVQIRKVNE